MYKIDIGEIKELKTEAASLREALKQAGTVMQSSLTGMDEVWIGETKRAADACGERLIQGTEEAESQLIMLENVLGDAIESAMLLKDRCRKLEDILKGEAVSYLERSLVDEAYWEGQITLEEETVTDILSACDRAGYYTGEMKKGFFEMENMLSCLEYAPFDISESLEAIYSECKKLHRIEEYGNAYRFYAEGMLEINERLAEALMPCIGETYKDTTMAVLEPAVKPEGLNVQRIAYLLAKEGELSDAEGKELDAALLELKLQGYSKETEQLGLMLIQQIETGLTERERDYLFWYLEVSRWRNVPGSFEAITGIQDKAYREAYIPQKITNKTVLNVYELLRTSCKIPQEQIEENARINREVFASNAMLMQEGFIENQAEWNEVQFGSSERSNMQYSGCEIIATYNALYALGEEVSTETMVELISVYEKDGTALYGDFGVSPVAIKDYFKEAGYQVAMTDSRDEEIINKLGEERDVLIVTVYNDQKDITAMVHTVCVSKEEGGYVLHNTYNIDNKTNQYVSNPVDGTGYPTLQEAIEHISVDTSVISIIGIKDRFEAKHGGGGKRR